MRAGLRARAIVWMRPFFANHTRLKALILAAERRRDLLKHSAAERFPVLINPQLRNLTIAITAQCNLRCIGCRYGRDFMVGEELSWPIMRNLLNDAKTLGAQAVRLYGGEPLLHRDLARFVRHAVGLKLKPYVTTNGMLLKDRLPELYEAGLRDLTIGFYGTGASYDGYVQRKDSFNRFEDSIATARHQYGMGINLRLNWLLMRPTCNTVALREAWSFARKYSMPIQVDLIHYSLPYFSEGPDRELQFRPEDRPAIERVVCELLRLKQECPDLLDQSEMGLRSIPDWLLKGPNMKVPCDKYQMLWVGADGTVQLCYVTFKLGNLHNRRLLDMVNGETHRQAARDCFALKCPNCHCGYDSRVQKHAESRRQYGMPASDYGSASSVGESNETATWLT